MRQYFSLLFSQLIHNAKLPYFWLPSLLFLLIGTLYYQPNVGGSGTDLPINLLGWGSINISLCVGLWHLYHAKTVTINSRLSLIGIVCLITFIPLLYAHSSPQISTWFRFLAIPLAWCFLFFSLQTDITQKQRHIIITTILIAIGLQAILGVAQIWLIEAHFRPPFGQFQQVNLMGSYLMTGYAIALYLSAQHLSKPACVAMLILVFTFGLITLQLDSRSTLLYAACISAIAILQSLKERTWRYAPVMLSLAVGLLMSTAIPPKQNSNSAQQVTPMPINSEASTTIIKQGVNTNKPTETPYTPPEQRPVLYQSTLQMIGNNLIFGVGYGNFEAAYTHWGAQQAKQTGELRWLQYNMDHPHNEFLYWFAEGGIVAGIAVTVFFLAMTYWLLQYWRKEHYLVVTLFLPIAMHSLLEYPLHASATHVLLLLILIRLFILTPENSPAPKTRLVEIPASISTIFRPATLFIAAFSVAFVLTGLHTIQLVLTYELNGGRSSEPYTQILNPYVHYDRYWSNIMAHKAIAAANANNEKNIKEYLAWAEVAIKHHPKQMYFENIIRLKHYLGDNIDKDCQRYEFYFPHLRCATLLPSAN